MKNEKNNKSKSKYLDRADYLEWRDINNEIDKSERDLADKNRLLVYNDLKMKFHRSEAERNNLLANVINNEEKVIRAEMEKDDKIVKDKRIKLEEFIDKLQSEKGIVLKDHTINPITLELKPVLLTNK